MTERQWAKNVPVVTCKNCVNGNLSRHDYNEDITCPVCNGSGTMLKKRWKTSLEISELITKNLSDGHRNKHR